jgi:hydroxymethylpyrimidine kinase/phosphomethylpyrimidine kinase/thiamine-phosphate diphosphorylase
MPKLDATGFLLTIAGHDPTGGAGLSADMAAWQAMGWKGASVCTALTVQNAQGVQQVLPTSPALLRAALAALCVEADPVAVKVGMLGDAAVAAEVAAFCADLSGPVVWDPVLDASAGGIPLLRADRDETGGFDDAAVRAGSGHTTGTDDGAGSAGSTGTDTSASAVVLRAMAQAATVITPNRVEAATLLDLPAWTDAGPIPAAWLQALRAQWLHAGRTQAVVLKGGHAQGAVSVDWLVTRDHAQPFVVPRLAHGAHGTGCLYAATIAAMLAAGWSLVDAVVEAQWRTHAGIHQAWQLGGGRPMVNASATLDSHSLPARPLGFGERGTTVMTAPFDRPSDPPSERAAGAALSQQSSHAEPAAFAPLITAPGFYPVVPDADWALRLLDWGVCTLQLRIKDLHGAELAAAIARVSKAAAQVGAQLFINDHWREAIDAGAYGVHLGQEDLQDADLAALRAAGLRLGVSTHTPGELARAHALRPSYIALGPVYATTLKVMPYQPLGLLRLRDWAARCKPRYSTVAIGGISLQRAAGVMACGVDGFAVVSAVTQAADPQAAAREGLRLAAQALHCRAEFGV